MNPKANRAKMIEMMSEKFGFKGVMIAVQAVLTLYAQGLICKTLVHGYTLFLDLILFVRIMGMFIRSGDGNCAGLG